MVYKESIANTIMLGNIWFISKHLGVSNTPFINYRAGLKLVFDLTDVVKYTTANKQSTVNNQQKSSK